MRSKKTPNGGRAHYVSSPAMGDWMKRLSEWLSERSGAADVHRRAEMYQAETTRAATDFGARLNQAVAELSRNDDGSSPRSG